MTFSRKEIRLLLALLLAGIFLSVSLPTQVQADGKLPRFASLRSDKVNLRAGPGVRYPIAWIFVRKSLPVEILAEFELWRKVRSRDGTEGWVHKSLLSGRRSGIITGKTRTLFRRAQDSVPVLRLAPGVQGALIACKKTWCKMRVGSIEGWLKRKQFWGTYSGETFN